MPDCALELAVGEEVEVLADRPVEVRSDDDVRTAGPGLQAGVQGRSRMRAALEVDRGAVAARRQLHTQLKTQVVGGQHSLVAADELDVPETRAARAAELGQRLRGIELSIGGMR